MYYSIKMRAQANSRHISGAERIVPHASIDEAIQHLSHRALQHPNGPPDSLSITAHKITEEVKTIPSLPVSDPKILTPTDARMFLHKELTRLGLDCQPILDLFYSLRHMRGAALLHAHSLKRMEPDQQRGVRATCMDYLGNEGGAKNHLKEALCLASKVTHCPHIMAELCMSDDPEYTTGYFASKDRGYIRLHHIKNKGQGHGGRIFLFNGSDENLAECIHYLEKTPVMVTMNGV